MSESDDYKLSAEAIARFKEFPVERQREILKALRFTERFLGGSPLADQLPDPDNPEGQ